MAATQDARGKVITVASLLWDANAASQRFSKCYNEDWVTKLYNGFARNITIPWRFVLFTDRIRELNPLIKQELLKSKKLDYSTCIEPFRFGVPMILVGLDTIIVGNVDHLACYCLERDTLAVPKDPYCPERAANGVCLIPENHQYIYRNWRGENDMEWIRKQKHAFIDELFPGQVLSYKGDIKRKHNGNLPENCRIVYFHGDEKPHELEADWVKRHWM